MAVTIAETSGHVTETVLKSPLSPPVTMRRNDRSHSPKYAWSARRQRRSKAPGTGVVLKRVRPQTQARRAATHRADIVRRCTRVPRDRCSCGSPKATAAKRQQHGNTAPVDDDLGRKDSRIRKPRLHGAPHLVRHHVCLSVCSGLMVLFVRSHEAAAQSLSDLLRSTPGHHGHCGHLLSSTHHRVVNTLITAVDRLAPAPTRTRPRPKAGPNPGKKKRNSKLNVQIPTGSAQQPHHHQQNALTTPGTRRGCSWSRCSRRHSHC